MKIDYVTDIIVHLQLFITGLKLEEDTSLRLADLICGTSGKNFNNKTSYFEMLATYKKAHVGRIFRKYDFKLICEKAKEKGIDKMTTTDVM